MKNTGALIGMLSDVSSSMNHHGGGYHLITRKMLNEFRSEKGLSEVDVNPDPESWCDYSELYIVESVNYMENSFNIIGGPTEVHKKKLIALANYLENNKSKVQLIHRNFDFNLYNKRFGIDYTFDKHSFDVLNLTLNYGMNNRACIMGDSHSLSVWSKGYGISRVDGRTLFGMMKREKEYFPNWHEVTNKVYDKTITYFGNIDLRFHLANQPDPIAATKELFNRYVNYSSKLKNNTIVGLLPVENESRKIPKTGTYKEKNYFGSRELRMELRNVAHEIIKNSGQKYIFWPDDWIDADGTKMFEYMEPRQSVHLKPKYYLNADQLIF